MLHDEKRLFDNRSSNHVVKIVFFLTGRYFFGRKLQESDWFNIEIPILVSTIRNDGFQPSSTEFA